MKKMKKTKKLFILFLMIFTMVSPITVPMTKNNVAIVEAATIKISKVKLTLEIGKSKILDIIGTNKKITWKSSKKSVATVTSKGKVTAIAAGTAKITATVANKNYTCKITVPVPKLTPKPKKKPSPTPTPSQVIDIIKLITPSEDLNPPKEKVTSLSELEQRIIYLNDNCPSDRYEIIVSGLLSINDISSIRKVINNDSSLFGVIRKFEYYYNENDKMITSIYVYVIKTLQYELARAFADEAYLDITTNSTVKEIYPIVEEILQNNIKTSMTDYEKEKAIHDYMVNSYHYDTSYTIYSVEGILLSKKGVCQAYADTFKLFMDLMGIECLTQSGKGNGESHIWNIVKLDGKWYNVDVTWDDPIAVVDMLRYDYFNVTDEQLSVDHTWEPKSGVSATATKYSYKE